MAWILLCLFLSRSDNEDIIVTGLPLENEIQLRQSRLFDDSQNKKSNSSPDFDTRFADFLSVISTQEFSDNSQDFQHDQNFQSPTYEDLSADAPYGEEFAVDYNQDYDNTPYRPENYPQDEYDNAHHDERQDDVRPSANQDDDNVNYDNAVADDNNRDISDVEEVNQQAKPHENSEQAQQASQTPVIDDTVAHVDGNNQGTVSQKLAQFIGLVQSEGATAQQTIANDAQQQTQQQIGDVPASSQVNIANNVANTANNEANIANNVANTANNGQVTSEIQVTVSGQQQSETLGAQVEKSVKTPNITNFASQTEATGNLATEAKTSLETQAGKQETANVQNINPSVAQAVAGTQRTVLEELPVIAKSPVQIVIGNKPAQAPILVEQQAGQQQGAQNQSVNLQPTNLQQGQQQTAQNQTVNLQPINLQPINLQQGQQKTAQNQSVNLQQGQQATQGVQNQPNTAQAGQQPIVQSQNQPQITNNQQVQSQQTGQKSVDLPAESITVTNIQAQQNKPVKNVQQPLRVAGDNLLHTQEKGGSQLLQDLKAQETQNPTANKQGAEKSVFDARLLQQSSQNQQQAGTQQATLSKQAQPQQPNQTSQASNAQSQSQAQSQSGQQGQQSFGGGEQQQQPQPQLQSQAQPQSQALGASTSTVSTANSESTNASARFSNHLNDNQQTRKAHEQLSVKIQQAHDKGQQRINIQLRPVELGRVDVQIEMLGNGKLQLIVAPEKIETLELLQRDSSTLQQTLQNVGLELDSKNLTFLLRQDFAQGQKDNQSGNNPKDSADNQGEDTENPSDEQELDEYVTVTDDGRINARV